MITNETAKSIYTIADGVTTYAIGFQYDYNPDGTPQIQLYLNNHPESPLVYGTDYTLSGDELSVVLLDNYSVGDRLYILRNIPMVQLSDYVIGRIDPGQIEKDFDECVMRDQQLEAEIETLGEMPIDHEQRITTIEDEIPDEASSANQLADKAYVGTQISNHTNRTDNPHSVTAAQVGLGNCNNTSDADKPVSTATQNALDLKANSSDLAAVAMSGSYSDLTGAPSLASVATSGDYDDLTNKPTLGTAAAADTTDFATATQGGKADTAVQPGDLATVATSGAYFDLSGTPTIPDGLADLTDDVNITTPTTGDHLVYNGTSQKWENTPSSASVSWGGITGTLSNQTDLQNALDGKAATTNSGVVVAEQLPTLSNNYQWYRKYANGWVEQGGFVKVSVSAGVDASFLATFPVAMKDVNYTIQITLKSGNSAGLKGSVETHSTTSLGGWIRNQDVSTDIYVYWTVCGIAAS